MSESESALETPSGDKLLAELTEEFLSRYRTGERPTMDEYASKYPKLAHRIRDVFAAVVMMEQPGVDTAFDIAPSAERVGAIIGRYKLLERIGEGGFGVVFMAEQMQPVRRKVAVKVIKPGFDTRQVIARFEAERQALALMEHENIAKVLDAGSTDSGRPYFVMELVRGVPITEFCDANDLPLRERLELFAQVCRAVQHAHMKGIIHRDIKPTNVLVTLHDGVPVPKVIDFGVAKATDQQLTDKTLFTNFAQLVGTPLYMSPEQAEMTNIDVDTRSDVYSLGVLLYELLTGTTPLDKDRLKQSSFDEVRRIIRDEDPPRPSTRLRTMGEEARSILARRKSDPKQFGQLVRGELDWIVMKALEKERARRYDTAIGFAHDIECHLRGDPVEACPQSALYRLRKFARRNRGPVLAAGVVMLTLVGGIFGTTFGLVRAERARQTAANLAQEELRAKEEVQKRLTQIENGTEILASVFRDLDPHAADKEAVTLRDLLARRLEEAARLLEREAVGDPLIVARLQHPLGISLRELGHLEQAESVLVKSCRTRERLLGSDHLDTVATKHDLALLYRDQGKYGLAEALQEQVVSVRTTKLGSDHPDTLTSQHHLAIFYVNQRKWVQAETLSREVLAMRTRKLGADHPDTLTTKHRLALLYWHHGKFDLADTLYKEVLAIRIAKLGPDNLHTIATKANLAALKLAVGQTDLAEPLLNEVLAVRIAKLGPNHNDTLASQNRLASLYVAQGKTELAEALYKEVIAKRTATLGADHPDTLRSRSELAVAYFQQGNYTLAETHYKAVLAIRSAKLSANHRDTLNSQFGLAVVYRCMKKPELAIPLLEDAIQRSSSANNFPVTVGMQAELGAMYCDAGRFDDAIALLEEVQAQSHQNPELAWIGNPLLTAYVRAGRKADAVALAMQQVQTAREQLPADSLELAVAVGPPGQALMEVGEYADAEPLLVANFEGLKQNEGHIPPQEKDSLLRDAIARLVELYDAWGKPDEAAKWRQELAARTAEKPEN
jgi:serine/threonine protein kinase/tetratricopeptide (TPR) repeat protein